MRRMFSCLWIVSLVAGLCSPSFAGSLHSMGYVVPYAYENTASDYMRGDREVDRQWFLRGSEAHTNDGSRWGNGPEVIEKKVPGLVFTKEKDVPAQPPTPAPLPDWWTLTQLESMYRDVMKAQW